MSAIGPMFSRMASQIQYHISVFQINRMQESKPKVPIQPIRPIQRTQSREGPSSSRDSPKPPKTTVQKKTRRGVIKSKSGCQTCKVRHTKCDETRPACTRCTSTGRKCDYTQTQISISRRHPPTPPPRTSSLLSSKSRAIISISHPTAPLPTFELTQQDGHYFQYLCGLCQSNLGGAFDTPLWTLLLQVCATEPCIRHVALGMAMMHQLYPFIVSHPSDPAFLSVYRAALKHYAKSIKTLKERLAAIQGKADLGTWEVSLLASMLFTDFEVLVGNEYGAYWQMDSGFKLIKSALDVHNTTSNIQSLPGNLGELALAFNRLDVQATTFSLWYETKALLPSRISDSFTSMCHAKDMLDILTANILSVIRSKTPSWYKNRVPNEPLPGDLALQVAELKRTLQYWLDLFQGFLISSEFDILDKNELSVVGKGDRSAKRIQEITAHHTLMIQYWVAYIWLYTSFSLSQTIFDAYLAAFTTISDLAEDILVLQPSRTWYYTADTQVVQPLFYVVQKCRDGHLRRRALRLLKDAGREGVWDSQCSAAACAWIVAKEEEGLEGHVGHLEAGRKGFVEESYRLKDATITYNRLGRSLWINCKRNGLDGTEELVEGFARWGEREVDEVLYGEQDNLWQNGALFG